jgi:RES domain-containing protein
VGHFLAPLDPPPSALCHWKGRFDDPERRFRTLYCAQTSLTCLYETLSSFRPSIQARKQFEDRFGTLPFGILPRTWRQDRVLIEAQIVIKSGNLVPLEEPGVRYRLEREPEVRDLLIALGISQLDMGIILGSERKLTQAIARSVHRWGDAGVRYPSRHGLGECAALFEGKAQLVAIGPHRPLTDDFPELVEVCDRWDLRLR